MGTHPKGHMVKIRHNKGNPIRLMKRPTRNDKCPCGSGQKFKNCHVNNWEEFIKELREAVKQQQEADKTKVLDVKVESK